MTAMKCRTCLLSHRGFSHRVTDWMTISLRGNCCCSSAEDVHPVLYHSTCPWGKNCERRWRDLLGDRPLPQSALTSVMWRLVSHTAQRRKSSNTRRSWTDFLSNGMPPDRGVQPCDSIANTFWLRSCLIYSRNLLHSVVPYKLKP